MSKKIGVMLLVAVMLIGICTAASATLYYVTGNRVRVRSGPGTDYDIVSHLDRGDKIDVISTSGGWARMTLYSGSDEGYISTKYISRKNRARTFHRMSTTPPVRATIRLIRPTIMSLLTRSTTM